MKRFVVECIWSGYRSSQERPCHRVVVTRPDHFRDIHTVQFTDNTTMSVSVRQCKPREKVKEVHGYDELLKKFIGLGMKGFVRVEDL